MRWKKLRQATANAVTKAKDVARKISPSEHLKKEPAKERERRMALPDTGYFPRLRRFWNYCFLSLPVDILLFASGLGILFIHRDAYMLDLALLITLCLALLSLFRQDIFLGVILLRIIRNKVIFQSKKIVLVVLLVIILGVTFLDSYLRSHGDGIYTIIVPTAAVFVAFVPAWKSIKERLHGLQRKARNRLIWVEELDWQHFIFLSLSLFPARLVSLIGACTLHRTDFFAYTWLASFFLLLYLEPKDSDFAILCKRCLKKTSRSLAGMRYCPACCRVQFFSPIQEALPTAQKNKNNF